MTYTSERKAPHEKISGFFTWKLLKTFHFKWEILLRDDHSQSISLEIMALFSNFGKRAGEISHPPPPSNYTPVNNISDVHERALRIFYNYCVSSVWNHYSRKATPLLVTRKIYNTLQLGLSELKWIFLL